MTKSARESEPDPGEPVFRAAGQLFRQKGFDAATVREIAAAAGMLPGSLHYRYASKEELLLALMERGITSAVAAVRLAIADVRDPLDRVRAALRAHLHLLVRDDEAIYVLLYEGRSLSGPAREHMVRLRDRYDALWDGLLHAAAGTGRIRPEVDLRLVRLFLLGGVNWAAQWFSPTGAYSADVVADAFADMVLRGLLIDPLERPTPDSRGEVP
ncbi:MAG: TetR/AcrR family transcriptional regulator [Longimicrobiaceae bacterium]